MVDSISRVDAQPRTGLSTLGSPRAHLLAILLSSHPSSTASLDVQQADVDRFSSPHTIPTFETLSNYTYRNVVFM